MTNPIKTDAPGIASADARTATSPRELPGAEAPQFAAILKEVSPPAVRRDQEETSPQQMFEAGAPDPRSARQNALRGEYRAALTQGDQRRTEARHELRTGRARFAERAGNEVEIGISTPVEPAKIPDRFTYDTNHSVESHSKENRLPTHSRSDAEQQTQRTTEASRALSNRSQGTDQGATAPDARPAADVSPAGGRNQVTTAAHEVARQLGSRGAVAAEREASTAPTTSLSRTSDAGTSKPRETAEAPRPSAAPRSNTKPRANAEAPATSFERLIRTIRAQSGRHSSARVLLDPPELGKVHVRVKVTGDKVEIGVETENDSAREIITQRAAKLRSSLEEHGLVVDRLEVTTNQSGLFDRPAVFSQEADRNRREAQGQSARRDGQGRERNSGSGARAPAIQSTGRLKDINDSLDMQV